MRFKILAIVFIFRDRKSNLMFEALLSQNLNSFGLIESTYNSFTENYKEYYKIELATKKSQREVSLRWAKAF